MNETAYEQHKDRNQRIREQFTCDCTDSTPRRRELDNGVTTVWLQCDRCGRGIRAVKKSEYDVGNLEAFNETTNADWHREKNLAYAESHAQLQRELDAGKQDADEEDRAWKVRYNEYLATHQWHDIRQRVLERDRHLCQACLKRRATEVHHLSYELYNRLGHSMGFELRAICHTCHCQIHPHMAEAQQTIMVVNPYLRDAMAVLHE